MPGQYRYRKIFTLVIRWLKMILDTDALAIAHIHHKQSEREVKGVMYRLHTVGEQS